MKKTPIREKMRDGKPGKAFFFELAGASGSRGDAMSDSHSDALVFFGATGDLAYKKT